MKETGSFNKKDEKIYEIDIPTFHEDVFIAKRTNPNQIYTMSIKNRKYLGFTDEHGRFIGKNN